MYSTHNEGKSVITEMFIKAIKAKIYKNITASDSKSYLSYLNNLVDEYNNTYHRSINKKPINPGDFTVKEKIEPNIKACKFKVFDRARITKYKSVFSKGYTDN